MARGRAYSFDFRLAMMKQHAQGRSLSTLSRETDVPRDVLRRWWQRYAAGGAAALRPRSRRPRRSPTQVPAATEAAILALRHAGLGPGAHRVAGGAERLDGVPHVGAPWPAAVAPAAAARTVRRYEKTRPGELVHVDLKYLPRLENRAEFECAAVDDFTREAVVWIAGARTTHNATAFLEQLVATLPYPIEAVMTDNDLVFTMRFAYYRQRRTRFEEACRSLGIRHRLLRPACA